MFKFRIRVEIIYLLYRWLNILLEANEIEGEKCIEQLRYKKANLNQAISMIEIV